MSHNDDNLEFDVKALVFYVLRRWKAILIAGVIFALLLGGWKAYSENKTAQNESTESRYWLEYRQYEKQIAFYEERIAFTQTKIDTLQEYINSSILMKLDPRNVYRAKAVYYVDTDYKIMPEYTYQNKDKTDTLTWFYRRAVNDYNVYVKIGEQIGIEPKYLMEAVSVSAATDSTLHLSVTYTTPEGATEILRMLQDEIATAQKNLTETIGAHTITKMEDNCGVYIDDGLKDTQQKVSDELLELKDEQLEYSEELLELRTEPAPEELNVLGAFIKWCVLGGAIGVVLVIAYLLVKVLVSNRVYAASQLSCRYHMPVLGEVIFSKKALSFGMRKLNGLEGCLIENSGGNLQYIAQNIQSHCAGAKNIVLCGDTNPVICKKLAQSLNLRLSGVQIVPVGDLLKEAEALYQLTKCDLVVLVAEREKSRNGSIEKMLEMIRSCNKDILGFIVAY